MNARRRKIRKKKAGGINWLIDQTATVNIRPALFKANVRLNQNLRRSESDSVERKLRIEREMTNK